MNPSANEMLYRLREVLGLDSDTALSRFFGYSDSTLANRARNNGMPYKEAAQVAVEQGISLDWLILGRGLKHFDETSGYDRQSVGFEIADADDEEAASAAERAVLLAYHDQRVPRSMLPDNDDQAGSIPLPQRLFDSIGVHPARCAVMRVGEEMMGCDYQVGDLVIYENADEPFGGVCVVALQDRVRLRRVHVLLSGRLRLHCDADGYDDEDMEFNPIHGLKIIGRVVATIRMRR